jgi:hypothetical protein
MAGEKLLFIPVPTISLTFSAGKPQILAPAWVKIKMRALFVCVCDEHPMYYTRA